MNISRGVFDHEIFLEAMKRLGVLIAAPDRRGVVDDSVGAAAFARGEHPAVHRSASFWLQGPGRRATGAF